MDDTFRLDLSDYGQEYVQDVLNSFFDGAANHGRKVIEIRMTEGMSEKLGIKDNPAGRSFRGVPVKVGDTGFEGTIEVVLGPLH
jgi:hypothetical protein